MIIRLLEYCRILHWLADPTNGKACSRINQDYLQKAIDVLVHTESRFQHHNQPMVYKERATCHYKKGEVEDALTYSEFAFYADADVKRLVCLKQLCN